MRGYRFWTLALLLQMQGLVWPATSAKPSPDETAKFLAGIRSGSAALSHIEGTHAWSAYANSFDETWAQMEKSRLSAIKTWAAAELGTLREQPEPVFYPLSGPDFLYVHTFFPKGTSYLMCGLEPVGSLPDPSALPGSAVPKLQQELQTSLSSLRQFSFFQTNDMKVDLKSSYLNGVLPLICMFLARSGLEISEITMIDLDATGQVIAAAGSKAAAVRVAFRAQGATPQSLVYFQQDVSNEGLKKRAAFLQYIRKAGRGVGYMKAASYLLHRETFSQIRDAMLAECNAFLEDDSGIPLKYFSTTDWKITVYGAYTQPIPLFKERYQADLRKLYKTEPKPKPLPFGIGYKHNAQDSNLLWSVRKN